MKSHLFLIRKFNPRYNKAKIEETFKSNNLKYDFFTLFTFTQIKKECCGFLKTNEEMTADNVKEIFGKFVIDKKNLLVVNEKMKNLQPNLQDPEREDEPKRVILYNITSIKTEDQIDEFLSFLSEFGISEYTFDTKLEMCSFLPSNIDTRNMILCFVKSLFQFRISSNCFDVPMLLLETEKVNINDGKKYRKPYKFTSFINEELQKHKLYISKLYKINNNQICILAQTIEVMNQIYNIFNFMKYDRQIIHASLYIMDSIFEKEYSHYGIEYPIHNDIFTGESRKDLVEELCNNFGKVLKIKLVPDSDKQINSLHSCIVYFKNADSIFRVLEKIKDSKLVNSSIFSVCNIPFGTSESSIINFFQQCMKIDIPAIKKTAISKYVFSCDIIVKKSDEEKLKQNITQVPYQNFLFYLKDNPPKYNSYNTIELNPNIIAQYRKEDFLERLKACGCITNLIESKEQKLLVSFKKSKSVEKSVKYLNAIPLGSIAFPSHQKLEISIKKDKENEDLLLIQTPSNQVTYNQNNLNKKKELDQTKNSTPGKKTIEKSNPKDSSDQIFVPASRMTNKIYGISIERPTNLKEISIQTKNSNQALNNPPSNSNPNPNPNSSSNKP